jgi:uncharacterized RmlC-like cupin family protein
LRWIWIGVGDIFHTPGGAKHAVRNESREPAVSIVIRTARMVDSFARSADQ